LYEGLLSVLQTKLEAMQRADLHAMRELSLQEHALVRQIQEREGMRRQLMDRMGEAQELPTRTAGTMTISKLASRLPVLHREALMGEADSLRRCVGRVAQINRVVDAASREVLHHLQWVMASVGPADEKSLGYGNHGSGVPPTGSRILEVIG
jgi:hypothetical protein